jgi:putative pyruvate formate lyase activating enzyme
MATKFSSAPDYFDRCKESLQEMFRQVGDLETDAKGIATKGLLVRHLVLPNNTAGSEQSLQFIADLSIHTYVNIMAQYTPHGKAKNHKEINRPVTLQEVQSVKNFAKKVGLYRGF